MTTPQQPGPELRLGRVSRTPAEPTMNLGQVVPPAEPTEPAQPSADETVHLGQVAPPTQPPAEETVRLAPEPEPLAEVTVRLEAKPWPPAGQTSHLGPPAPAEDVANATFLDPSWTTAAQPPQDELRRFGPGVPPQAAAVWHGTAQQPTPEPEPRRRRKRGWLVPLLVLLAVLAYFAWQRYSPATTVTAVSVTADPAGPSCDGTAVVTGSLETDGGAGTVQYHWKRSDGTDSGLLSQPVPRGHHRTDVVLRWTFQGHGSMQATATLEVVSPTARTAAATFTYTCA
ncbi:hypothetical protein GCM10010193_15400 [Kitasatospora atroaurantiaca]|uniref:Uncharacterized protein n=1 Tax=Kitasatospora atroaurantiaca TaxID=285545 RepID=A0A561EII1_9ACTN|nr:hypothetical protein [Kitasatospora atroaurantiaca]TWE15427.1 hypothetical protein FB465_0320 [Kitasatospora atroaurantiaca]